MNFSSRHNFKILNSGLRFRPSPRLTSLLFPLPLLFPHLRRIEHHRLRREHILERRKDMRENRLLVR